MTARTPAMTRAPASRGAREDVAAAPATAATSAHIAHEPWPEGGWVHAGEAGVVAPLERIKGWLRMANVGDRFAYATRRLCALPEKSATAAYLRQLEASGIVTLAQLRVREGGTTYLAQRTSRALPLTADVPVPPPAMDYSARAKVMKILIRRAALSRPTPSDAEIASLLGYSRAVIGRVLDRLIEDGEIVVEGRASRRVITIVRSGEWTEVA